MTLSTILIIAVCAVIIFGVAVALKRKNTSQNDVESFNEQIYVGNLPYRVNEDDLRNYFSSFGSLESVRIIRNFKTGDSKGYAFVTYTNADEAKAALVSNGKDMQGRAMVVRIAKPRQA